MEVLVKIAQLLVSLSILIVLHELGHYTLARIFKVRVEKFYLFFDAGFSLFKKKIGDTEYGIGWLPLGGYVKISGMIDESMDREAMKQPPKPYEFRSKKAWKRLLIMLGGVIVNFLLALFIYIIVFFKWGEEYVPVERMIYGYSFEQEFQDLGLQNGDKVLALDGEKVERWIAIHHDIVVNDPRVIEVERDGVIMDIQVPEGMTSTLLKLEYVMEPRVPCEVNGLREGGSMELAGVELNDRIVGVNGTPIQFYDEFKDLTRKEINTSFDLTILRGTDTLQIQASTDENGMFGISRKVYYDFYETVVVKYSLIQSIPAGINRGFEITGSYLKQLKMLFKPETKAYEELGGFIKIGSFQFIAIVC